MGRRLPLLLWKNLILRKRHWLVTTFQIILPAFLIMLLAVMYAKGAVRDDSELKAHYTGPRYPAQGDMDHEGLDNITRSQLSNTVVACTPSNPLTRSIIKQLNSSFSGTYINFKFFADESAIDREAKNQYVKSYQDGDGPTMDISAAIIFNKEFKKWGTTRPVAPEGDYSYTLRFARDNADTAKLFPSVSFGSQNGKSYVEIGFSGLQLLLDKAIIEQLTNRTIDLSRIQVDVIPFYGENSFATVLLVIVPLFLCMSFMMIVPSVVREVVSEKESGIKELMRIMGLPNWMHLLGWMIDSIMFLVITVSLVVILLCVKFNGSIALINNGDGFLVWVILLVYAIASVAMCMLISSFFEKPAFATTLGLLIWLATFFGLALMVESKYESLNTWLVLFLCVIPNVGLFMSLRIIFAYESLGLGAGWSNLYENLSMYKNDWLTLGYILLAMTVSIPLYLLLAVYVESVMPSTFGVRKPWYFPFMNCLAANRKIQNEEESKNVDDESQGEYFEPDPVDLTAGIQIRNLRKKFGNGKLAVDNLSLNIYKGQITALLGHNGAGKTTTMSILSGIIRPTHGTVIIDGHNIKTDLEGARKSLGLCPQHNMLFDRLTVMEHLRFFAKLKGAKSTDYVPEINFLISKLGLASKADDLSKSLSGGQKRKLNLAMALIGGSSVVILDEPTSGLDPESRRSIWDLLTSARGWRTMLLSTHMMEEADVLGDRIAIMAEGRLKCSGSPMFLKHKYGAGFTLRMTLLNKARPDDILSTVQKHVSDASFKGMPNAHELAIVLPSLENNAILSGLFSNLEANRQKLGIKSVGLSLTTMDEVFLKVVLLDQNIDMDVTNYSEKPSENIQNENSGPLGEIKSTQSAIDSESEQILGGGAAINEDEAYDDSGEAQDNPNLEDQHNQDVGSVRRVRQPTKLTGPFLHMLRVYAVLMKRIHYSRRKLSILILQVAIPVILLIWAILICRTFRAIKIDQPLLRMSVSSYRNPVIPYAIDTLSAELGRSYAIAVGKSAVLVPRSEGLEYYLKSAATKDIGRYRGSYVAAADFQKSWISYYSAIPNHALPMSLNLVTNTLLKSYTKNNQKLRIEVSNHPLRTLWGPVVRSISIANDKIANLSLIPLVFSYLFAIGLAILAAFLVIFPTEERLTNAKHLQLMSGIDVFLFWGTSLLWDMFCMVVIICILLCCFPIFQAYTMFTAYYALGALFLILLVYAFSAITFAYFVSLIVRTVSGGFSLIASIDIFLGTVFASQVQGWEYFDYKKTSIIQNFIGRICPFYGIFRSLWRFSVTVGRNSRCMSLPQELLLSQCRSIYGLSTCCRCYDSSSESVVKGGDCFQELPFLVWSEEEPGRSNYEIIDVAMPGIAQELLYSFLGGIFYFILVLVVDYGVFKLLFSLCKSRFGYANTDDVDEDVFEEANRVQSQLSTGEYTDAVALSHIRKTFGSFTAVADLTFGVNYGECFGLLGVNGAGKTTTFKILTGETVASGGDAFIHPYSVLKSRKEFVSRIGYCPQFDATLGVLSGKEMLQLFSRLRGNRNTSEETMKWLAKVGLTESANVQCQKYSGGMKRRLSTAIALIGDPPIVMLDEPTSGVDPVARRQFWATIQSNKELGQAIILTSHSMDECETLCSRLAIMVNGQLQCLGGVQHIKSKFAQGFTLNVKLKSMIPQDSPQLLSLIAEIEEKFQPCILKDRHDNILQYQVLKTDLPWAQRFEITEELKSRYADEIEDYSATETTLDEVFMSFARQQYPIHESGGGCCKCCS